MPTGLEAPASSQLLPLNVAPVGGSKTLVVGAWPMTMAPDVYGPSPTAMQAPAAGQAMSLNSREDDGALWVAQVAPPSDVASTTPGPSLTDVPPRPCTPLKMCKRSG